MLLSSIASNLLDVLPVNILTGLQDRLIEMLRGVEVDEHSTNLICLAILAKLTSVSSTNSKLSKDLSQPSLNLPLLETALSDNGAVSKSSRNYSLAQQFFSAERALKTLDLVVLKVILACSRSCTLLSKDVVESLKYSEEIVNAVTKDEKKNWLSRNGIKCRKLSEKISRHDIDPEIRHAVRIPLLELKLGF